MLKKLLNALRNLLRRPKPSRIWFKSEVVFAYKPLHGDVILPIIYRRQASDECFQRRACPARECYKGMVPDYRVAALDPEGRQVTKVCMVCQGNGFVGGE